MLSTLGWIEKSRFFLFVCLFVCFVFFFYFIWFKTEQETEVLKMKRSFQSSLIQVIRWHALNKILINCGKPSTLLPVHLTLSLSPFVFAPLMNVLLMPSALFSFICIANVNVLFPLPIFLFPCLIVLVPKSDVSSMKAGIAQKIPLSSSRNYGCKGRYQQGRVSLGGKLSGHKS